MCIRDRNYPDLAFHVRGHVLTITGESSQAQAAEELTLQLLEAARSGTGFSAREVSQLSSQSGVSLAEAILTVRGRAIRPQTAGQRRYVQAVADHSVVFGVGPAGSGKTYLAIAMAVRSLQRREVSKIVLTRPAVEAGERLGYLPGGLEEKIDPYLRPLFDALTVMLDRDTVQRMLESGAIEVAPLAYMRGRTLNEAFVILDDCLLYTSDAADE